MPDVPVAAAKVVAMLSQQALNTHAQLREIDRAILALQRTGEVAPHLATTP
jgi:transposase